MISKRRSEKATVALSPLTNRSPEWRLGHRAALLSDCVRELGCRVTVLDDGSMAIEYPPHVETLVDRLVTQFEKEMNR